MISRLDLGNFKSFEGVDHHLDLGRITLIYGPNSAGKSSLLQALAMLKQTIPAATFSTGRRPELILRGDYVDLGSFLTAVHNHDRQARISVGLEFTDPTPIRELGILAQEPIYAGVEFGLLAAGPAGGEADVPRQVLAWLGDGDHRVAFARREDDSFTLASENDQETLLRLIDARIRLYEESETAEAENLTLVKDAALSRWGENSLLSFIPRGFFPSLPTPGFLAGNRQLDLTFGRWFEEYLYSRARVVTEILDGLAYLGPLRSTPTRFQQLSSASLQNVGLQGEHTTRLLADRPDLVDDVNRWLTRLGIRYFLSVRPVVVPSDTGEVLGGGRMEIGDLVTTSLRHTESGIEVTPQDVGFGISQLLPVIVQLLVNDRATVCIEQPEVHIHPRLQAEVGDLLVDATLGDGRQNQVIVETHSESLILRIQRRIAEGYLGLTNEDVAVIYVDDEDGKAKPVRLPLDPEGSFTRPWPDGFFTERLDDLFAGDAEPMPVEARRPPPIDWGDA